MSNQAHTNTSVDLFLFLQAPCRKLLTTLIKGLDAHLFDSHHDIYMPNCDRRGFFRKKQVSLQTRWITQKKNLNYSHVICISICQKLICLFCWCSAGRLEVSSVAGAGVWIRTAYWLPQTLNRKATWVVKMHKTWKNAQSLDFSFLTDSGDWSFITQYETKMKEHHRVYRSPAQSHIPFSTSQKLSTSENLLPKSGVTLARCALYWTF